MKIWIILPDYGYDGLGEPTAAFKTEEKAKAVMATYNKPQDYMISEVDLEEDET